MEIVMKLAWGDYSYRTKMPASNPAYVCAELLREEIFLPKTVRKIYAVFTEKGVPNAFRIKPPDDDGYSELVGVEEYILSYTRGTLSKAYEKGFRYVRIEY